VLNGQAVWDIVQRRTMAGVTASGLRAAAAPVLSQCRSRVQRAPVALYSSPNGQAAPRLQLKQQGCSLLALQRQAPLRACRARQVQTCAAADSSAPAPTDTGFKWGADMKTLGLSVGIGALIWFVPPPAGVTLQAWHLLAVFVGTIVSIITTPLPLGAVAFLGLGASMLTKTLTFPQAFSAFSTEIPWLIAIAFWLSKGFIKSGLGNRIAYNIVSLFGKTTLGLTYSLVFAEALLAPAIPSVAARAGGIFFPLAQSLCLACGSDPKNGTEKKLGAYIMKTCFQTTCISSGMFITAMAANPLAVSLAKDSLGFTISWGQWALAGLVPGLIALVTTPAILYVLYPPEQKQTPDAPAAARKELEKLGPLSTDEKITAFAFAVTVSLWIFGSAIGVNAVAAALLGLGILLITGVTTWKENLAQGASWETLSWFAALIAMANHLNKFGFIAWFSNKVVGLIGGLGLQWQASFTIITLLYFYSHYLFASGAAHIGAMYTAFLSVSIAMGTPPLVAAIALGQLSNVMGCLSTYGIGSAPPYFAAGYVPQSKWYQLGFIMSIFYIAVWLFAGGAWWKVIGLW
jgi:anion transporter